MLYVEQDIFMVLLLTMKERCRLIHVSHNSVLLLKSPFTVWLGGWLHKAVFFLSGRSFGEVESCWRRILSSSWYPCFIKPVTYRNMVWNAQNGYQLVQGTCNIQIRFHANSISLKPNLQIICLAARFHKPIHMKMLCKTYLSNLSNTHLIIFLECWKDPESQAVLY